MFRILVIDDNPDMRDAIRAILEGAGYAVDLASDGALGLVLQRARPADLVITDMFMPNQDGLETIARLRSEFPRAKVIAMSRGADVVKGQDYLSVVGAIGAHRLLAKPIDPVELVDAVRDMLS
jgi:CheY-like chemotaxis protein